MTSTEGSHGVGNGVPPATSDFLHNEDVAHEHSDVNIRAVLTFAVGLAVTTVVAAIIVWGLLRYFEHEAATNDPPQSPLAAPSSVIPRGVGIKGMDPGALRSFPEPRLQINEPAGLKTLRDAEAEALDSYGWVDQKSGIARMPIEDAKKLILQRGIPTRAGALANPLLGTHAQALGEASAGRLLTHGGGQ